MKLVKKFVRWLILGLTVFLILYNLHQNWRSIEQIKITNFVWQMFALSIFFNALAHTFSAWVWTWILNLFSTKLQGIEAICVYLITNISKYLPGNVWHFVGRVKALQSKGDSLATATVAVIIEPLLMAIAALLITVISTSFGTINFDSFSLIFLGQITLVLGSLIGIHPRIMNPILSKLAKGKGSDKATKLTKYPLLPLIGETIFLLLRGSALIILLNAFTPVNITLIPQVLTAFSFAWMLGLIVPGAPGGMGVFEATIIATVDNTLFPQQIILVVVALFRISSILAEVITAYIAFIVNKRN